MRGKLKRGWSLEQAFKLEPPPKNFRPQNIGPITLDGMEYPSSAAAAKAHNIKPGTFARRIKEGWSPEQAVEITQSPNSINVEGKIFKT